jgi:hypothetical protein
MQESTPLDRSRYCRVASKQRIIGSEIVFIYYTRAANTSEIYSELKYLLFFFSSCLPIDLILSESQLVLGCLNCSKETSIKVIPISVHYLHSSRLNFQTKPSNLYYRVLITAQQKTCGVIIVIINWT